MKKHWIRLLSFLIALLLVQSLCAAPCLAFSRTATAAPSLSESEIMDYFLTIAFNVEYGDNNALDLRRWEQPIRIRVYGSPTEEDLATLDRHIADLNQIENMPFIQRVTEEENIELYFVALDDIHKYIDGYIEGNWGFFWSWWNEDQQITRVQIAIATDVTNQVQRNHLILEEITQSLGMMQDSNRYPDSIFYADWTEVQQLSPLDWALVKLTYDPDIEAGMTAAQVEAILGT